MNENMENTTFEEGIEVEAVELEETKETAFTKGKNFVKTHKETIKKIGLAGLAFACGVAVYALKSKSGDSEVLDVIDADYTEVPAVTFDEVPVPSGETIE